jgi:hypothetical protein
MAAAGLGFVAFFSSQARADVVVGASVGAAVPMSSAGYKAGVTTAARVGYQLPIPVLAATIEAQGGYTSFPPEALTGQVTQAKIARIAAGGRLVFGKFVAPFIAAHVGYGWLMQGAAAESSLPIPDLDKKGPALDTQLGIELQPAPLVRLGAEAGYAVMKGTDAAAIGANTIGANGALNWLTFGVNAALVF